MTQVEKGGRFNCMPARKTILATGETYHIFNRSIRQLPIFTDKREYKIFLMATRYYLQPKPPVRLSVYRQQKNKYEVDLSYKLVNIVAFCLMPDHYHFILTQNIKDGIRKFIHRLSDSYSHYFNKRRNQKGSIFEGKFKAVRVKSQEQLIHLSRYIHLNPVTNYLVEDPIKYEHSSYRNYLAKIELDFVDPSNVMIDFKTPAQYKKFVLDQKDYQRELKNIKHLIFFDEE